MSSNSPAAAIESPDHFASELFRLESLIIPLCGAMKVLESEEYDQDLMDDACRRIASAMKPRKKLSDEELAGSEWLTIGSQEAQNCAGRLIASWHMHRCAPGAHQSAEFLIEWARDCEHTGELGRNSILTHLPWMLTTVLDLMANDGVGDRPNSRGAIAARIIACMVDALRGIDGMQWEPNEGQVGHA